MGKKPWRPRHGALLSVVDRRGPSKVETSAKSLLGKIPKIFLSPIGGLTVGVLIRFSGRGELQLRSVGLLCVAVWLSADLWARLIKRDWKWKFVAGWTGTSLIFIGVMGIMWWLLDGKLQDQRDEVFAQLSSQHSIPEQANPALTVFTVSNNSSYALSGKHKLVCKINLMVGNNGTSQVSGPAWEALVPNSPEGKMGGVLGGSVAGKLLSDAAVTSYRDSIPTVEPLQPGGDAETNDCLRGTLFEHGADCIDMELVFWYSLQTQPDFKQEKHFRYVAIKEGPSFIWNQEPVQSTTSYCRTYYKAPS
jgi:hypothetical protein